jgi:hypothetical protein
VNDKLQQRLTDLRSEYDTGKKMLAELDTKRQNLTETLLRIQGAMQVLEEMLEPGKPDPANPPPGAESPG